MSWPTNITSRLQYTIKQMLQARKLLLAISITFVISLFWMQQATTPEISPSTERLILEAIENAEKDSRYSEVYRKTSRLSKEMKYMLLWTDRDYAPLYYFEDGQRAFVRNNCSVINCYVTDDRNFFGGDITKFDAIAFNGRNMKDSDLPKKRSMRQKYLYLNMESADNYPVCQQSFDDFFNWTVTYRLDSDVPLTYIMVRNSQGKIVGPKASIDWPDFPKTNEEYAEKLSNKSKAAAWFVSHCSSRNDRRGLAKRLQKTLSLYNKTVDIYGKCGPLVCPRDKKQACDKLLEDDYFFYLSFENTFAEDYVTEKLLTALHHDVVPIVYGGADYSRFLPPGSYLDAREHNANDLADIMDRIMNSPKLYQEFFRWKGHLVYSDPATVENVCDVCAALNDQAKFEKNTVYKEFRKWWHPSFHERCPGTPEP